uniref:Variant surface glycoprotein 1125.198 n=1 Tax=Trypanosoma brucei TaxID=5691 RepID=A0A1J0R5G6_9TRYP|nr:variant surface glycoprotein 1125.198 [Trypanosoma brucei]
MKLITLIATISVATTIEYSHAAVGAALKQSVAKQMCDYSKQAKGQHPHLKAKLATAKNNAAAAFKGHRQQSLAMLLVPQHSAASQVLTEYAEQLLAENLGHIETAATTAVTAVAQASYSAGRTDELLKLLKSMEDGSGNDKWCITASGGGSKANNNPTEGCEAQISEVNGDAVTNLGTTAKTTFAAPATTIAEGNGVCYLTASLATHADGDVSLLDGAIKIQNAGDIGNTQKFEANSLAANLIKPIADSYDEIGEDLQKSGDKMATTEKELEQLLKGYKANTKLKQAAAKINNWDSSKPDGDKTEYLKTIFGLNEDGSESSFITALKEAKRTVKTGASTSAETPILKMTDDQLREATEAALSELKLTANNSTNFPTKQLAAKAEAQKDCTKNTKKKDCKEGDGCKWDSTEATEGAFCKSKQAEGQAKQGSEAAATANGEGKKCSEKTKQEDCKDGCKWEGKEFKDSIFPVNNKLAFISTYFMSFVEFKVLILFLHFMKLINFDIMPKFNIF